MASPSLDLQKAILDALLANAAVAAIVGARVHDGLTPDAVYPCITFGPTQVMPEDMDCIAGREEVIQIDCWTRDGPRLHPAKALADAVKAALHLAALPMATHALADLRVEGMRVMMDPDGLTGHGVVTLLAYVEER